MNAVDAAREREGDRRAALDLPAGAPGFAIVGPPGSGKTHVLLERARRFGREGRHVLVTSPNAFARARLRAQLAEVAAVRCEALAELAFEIVRAESDEGRSLELIDDARASIRFEHVGGALFALDWTEFASAEIDPEITGLRAPERFAAAAFRLFRKLRASLVSPEDFKTSGLRGATDFYGRPPNFADASLIAETAAPYRDSLRVTPHELARQREREIDLVKILARLYASYAADVAETGRMTASDAIYDAVALLRARPAVRERARRALDVALVDDAHDLTDGEVALLEGLFGETLAGVTFAGDPSERTRGFGGGARLTALRKVTTTFALEGNFRNPTAVADAATFVLAGGASVARAAARTRASLAGIVTYRAESQRDEARFVAGEIVRAIAGGTPPARIALVARNLACAHPYLDALLARDVPVDPCGAANLYEFPVVLDALAALWAATDPFRHDYLTRNLEAPWLRLSDASIAALCAEAPGAQPLLFELPGEEPDDEGGPRWDRRRDLRLGRNLTRGDADASLPSATRERIAAFRGARERWEQLARRLDLPALARTILAETVLAVNGEDARGRFDAHAIGRLLEEIDAFAQRTPLGGLDDFLAFAEREARAEGDLLTIAPRDAGAVRICDPDALAGAEFDDVFIVDVRAGAWPRYYVPDAFLFAPSVGMIAKDNVGDARAARTAKFSWASARLKFRTHYNDEDRRAFFVAATRARKTLTVTAWGRATRGRNTPELLAELENARDLIRS